MVYVLYVSPVVDYNSTPVIIIITMNHRCRDVYGLYNLYIFIYIYITIYVYILCIYIYIYIYYMSSLRLK